VVLLDEGNFYCPGPRHNARDVWAAAMLGQRGVKRRLTNASNLCMQMDSWGYWKEASCGDGASTVICGADSLTALVRLVPHTGRQPPMHLLFCRVVPRPLFYAYFWTLVFPWTLSVSNQGSSNNPVDDLWTAFASIGLTTRHPMYGSAV